MPHQLPLPQPKLQELEITDAIYNTLRNRRPGDTLLGNISWDIRDPPTDARTYVHLERRINLRRRIFNHPILLLIELDKWNSDMADHDHLRYILPICDGTVGGILGAIHMLVESLNEEDDEIGWHLYFEGLVLTRTGVWNVSLGS